MKTEIQNTELYQSFKKALGINDMRTDDNPYVVECCKIAENYAKFRLSAVMESDCDHVWLNNSFDQLGLLHEQICDKCGAKQSVQ